MPEPTSGCEASANLQPGRSNRSGRLLTFCSRSPTSIRNASNSVPGGQRRRLAPTILLGAVDPRPAVAFPAVMVSTNMQGGCVCENADLLRVGINNVAIAALFAPKPLAMSRADLD